MSDCEQVVENIAYAERGLPDSLSQTELDLFEKVKAEYGKRMKVPCTGCKYCMPCPSGVNIPECFEMYNTACMFDAPEVANLTTISSWAACCLESPNSHPNARSVVSARRNARRSFQSEII